MAQASSPIVNDDLKIWELKGKLPCSDQDEVDEQTLARFLRADKGNIKAVSGDLSTAVIQSTQHHSLQLVIATGLCVATHMTAELMHSYISGSRAHTAASAAAPFCLVHNAKMIAAPLQPKTCMTTCNAAAAIRAQDVCRRRHA